METAPGPPPLQPSPHSGAGAGLVKPSVPAPFPRPRHPSVWLPRGHVAGPAGSPPTHREHHEVASLHWLGVAPRPAGCTLPSPTAVWQTRTVLVFGASGSFTTWWPASEGLQSAQTHFPPRAPATTRRPLLMRPAWMDPISPIDTCRAAGQGWAWALGTVHPVGS